MKTILNILIILMVGYFFTNLLFNAIDQQLAFQEAQGEYYTNQNR